MAEKSHIRQEVQRAEAGRPLRSGIGREHSERAEHQRAQTGGVTGTQRGNADGKALIPWGGGK